MRGVTQPNPIERTQTDYYETILEAHGVRLEGTMEVNMLREALAAQLIYTRVEKNQSPHRIDGFQTVFFTRSSLERGEVAEIESRLIYDPRDDEPIKKMYFRTRFDKRAVVLISPLLERDGAGRSG